MKEIWKDIKGYEGLYQVSNFGRVKSLKFKPKVLKNVTNYGYYPTIYLFKNNQMKMFKIHRLVAKIFIDNPNNFPCVNHKDGQKTHNNVTNLEWVTIKKNNIHAIKNKLHHKSNLTKDDIIKIRKLRIKNKTYFTIAKLFNISCNHASRICRKIYYKDKMTAI